MPDLLLFIAPLAAALLTLVLILEARGSEGPMALFKTLLSALFILTALCAARPLPTYFGWLFAGLGCCLVGDICLAFKSRPAAFRLGLVAFLLGHVCYIVAFARLTHAGWWLSPALPLAGAVGWLVYRWLRPFLGPMKGPVAAYIVVISLMIVAAIVLQKNPMLSPTGLKLVLAGSAAFYVSDLLVARDRFVRPGMVNRYIGLPLYYLGQFSLAASIGLMM